MLTVAFGEATMSRIQVQLWYNRFKEGWEDASDDVRPVRPSMSTSDENIDAVKKIILESLLERLLMMLPYRSAHARQFLRMFLAWNLG